MLHPAIAAVLGTTINVAAAMLPGGALRKLLALALAFGALALPFYTEAPPAFHQVQGTMLGLQALRVIEIVRDPSRFGRGERFVRITTMYETTLMKRAPRSFAIGTLLLGLFLAVLSGGGFLLASRLVPPTTPYAFAGWPRWLLTAAAGYFFLEGWGRIWIAMVRPFGWEHPLLQRQAIRSRTLGEFWGVRWNYVVSRWLKANAFDPIARRGAPRIGVLAAFFVSALLHAYMTLSAVGLVAAIWMGSFFLAHGVAQLVESAFRIRSRVFVFGVFLVTLPPFAEAFLRGFGL